MLWAQSQRHFIVPGFDATYAAGITKCARTKRRRQGSLPTAGKPASRSIHRRTTSIPCPSRDWCFKVTSSLPRPLSYLGAPDQVRAAKRAIKTGALPQMRTSSGPSSLGASPAVRKEQARLPASAAFRPGPICGGRALPWGASGSPAKAGPRPPPCLPASHGRLAHFYALLAACRSAAAQGKRGWLSGAASNWRGI